VMNFVILVLVFLPLATQVVLSPHASSLFSMTASVLVVKAEFLQKVLFVIFELEEDVLGRGSGSPLLSGGSKRGALTAAVLSACCVPWLPSTRIVATSWERWGRPSCRRCRHPGPPPQLPRCRRVPVRLAALPRSRVCPCQRRMLSHGRSLAWDLLAAAQMQWAARLVVPPRERLTFLPRPAHSPRQSPFLVVPFPALAEAPRLLLVVDRPPRSTAVSAFPFFPSLLLGHAET
jgi:hypothetical protein